MNEIPPFPQETPPGAPPPPSPPPTTSLLARLLNVFATPSDVFEEVRLSKPTTSNWLVPASLMAVVGAIAVFIIFSQPAIVQKIREKQQQAFDQQVTAGKMTRAQADQAMETSAKFFGPETLKILGMMSVIVASFALIFWWAFVLWLVAAVFLRVRLHYMKLAEVVGLASTIGVLQQIVRMLLVVSFSNPMASPSLAMLLKNPDPQNSVFTLLSAVDIMSIWVLAVRSIGLARLANVSVMRAAILVFGSWWLLFGCMVGISSAVQSVFGR